jgi:hypothetical protein
MKKAKIMLSAIAILAVVGGAFAFKAQRSGAVLYYYDTIDHKCTATALLPYTTNRAIADDPTPITSLRYSTTAVNVLNQLCPTITVYSFN